MTNNVNILGKCPPIDPHLVKYLEALFPVNPAAPNNTLSEVMFAGGQAHVVGHLRMKLTQQEENFDVSTFRPEGSPSSA